MKSVSLGIKYLGFSSKERGRVLGFFAKGTVQEETWGGATSAVRLASSTAHLDRAQERLVFLRMQVSNMDMAKKCDDTTLDIDVLFESMATYTRAIIILREYMRCVMGNAAGSSGTRRKIGPLFESSSFPPSGNLSKSPLLSC